MRLADAEIKSVEQMEDERRFQNTVDKVSVVKLAQRLKILLERIDETNLNEKKIMSYEIDQMRDAMTEREKRLQQENKQLKREKEQMFAKVTSLNPDDPSDMVTLREVLAELKAGNNASSK